MCFADVGIRDILLVKRIDEPLHLRGTRVHRILREAALGRDDDREQRRIHLGRNRPPADRRDGTPRRLGGR